jgi:class 3 adenylate cyclase
MRYPDIHYCWQWDLQSSPEALWPLVADTNRFDRDAGSPAVEVRPPPTGRLTNARLRLRQRRFGVPLEYVQEPYEWVYPSRYGVLRRYSSGPLAQLRVLADFTPRSDGGTQVSYQVWVRARNPLGLLGTPIQVGILFARSFEASFRSFDRLVASGQPLHTATETARFAPGGRKRLVSVRSTLLAQGADPALLDRLIETVEQGDSVTLARLRPYALADIWSVDRSDVLKLCLLATRYGLLDFRWELLCPLCRNARDSSTSLGGIRSEIHCDTCNIDFTANFERSVELTFRPNPAIRTVEETEYCVGGPEMTPHIVVQQFLTPGEQRTVTPSLEPGRYRVRALELGGGQYLHAGSDGSETAAVYATGVGWPDEEPYIATSPALQFDNQTSEEQLFILERVAWTDQAATAAEVTLLQMFRDLFANEALRPGERISVGSLAVMFTDLRNSTRLYREIGDAPAFGMVMSHFDILRDAVIAEGGAVVKTIGDAVMAIFRTPAAALRAALRSQQELESLPRPLTLKAGIHFGPCIAVTLNDRLDYFGSTVNMASRLEALSMGDDVIVSMSVHQDPEVAEWLADPASGLAVNPVRTTLKGFDEEHFDLCSIKFDTHRSAAR